MKRTAPLILRNNTGVTRSWKVDGVPITLAPGDVLCLSGAPFLRFFPQGHELTELDAVPDGVVVHRFDGKGQREDASSVPPASAKEAPKAETTKPAAQPAQSSGLTDEAQRQLAARGAK